MRSDLKTLKITPNEVDDYAELTVVDQSAIAFYRAIAFKQSNQQRSNQLWSFLLAELFTLAIIIIFVVPLMLISLRNSKNLTNEISTATPVLLSAFALSLVIFLVWNGYLWRRIKQIKPTVKLLREVERFNQVIQSIELLDRLESVQAEGRSSDLENRQQVLQVLQLTRDNLANALRADKILRLHKHVVEQRYEVIANFEDNLAELMGFTGDASMGEYRHLLNDALQINLSVHQEMRKL